MQHRSSKNPDSGNRKKDAPRSAKKNERPTSTEKKSRTSSYDKTPQKRSRYNEDKWEDKKPRRNTRSYDDRPTDEKPRRGFGARKEYGTDDFADKKPRRNTRSYDDNTWEERKPRRRRSDDDFENRPSDRRRTSKNSEKKEKTEKNAIRLNRYIARSGICSRREADELIATGEVKVNGIIVTEMGIKVTSADKVHVSDQLISFERPVYLLLNKPKGYITTTDDPMKRKTVMELVGNACKEHILPVGRLDRNTTGVLLFTNDGDMAKKLTHPSGNIRKVYHVHLDKALTKKDLLDIADGIELDDGFIKPDVITYVGDGEDKKEIGMELHSGRNRIVRRIFEQLGYEVVKLDRVIFANLTKKDLRRGHHRFLTEQEINWLKMI